MVKFCVHISPIFSCRVTYAFFVLKSTNNYRNLEKDVGPGLLAILKISPIMLLSTRSAQILTYYAQYYAHVYIRINQVTQTVL